jgi:hypothetical protein
LASGCWRDHRDLGHLQIAYLTVEGTRGRAAKWRHIFTLFEQTVALDARYRASDLFGAYFCDEWRTGLHGADRVELFRGAASFIDRILRGQKPGEMPYQIRQGTSL